MSDELTNRFGVVGRLPDAPIGQATKDNGLIRPEHRQDCQLRYITDEEAKRTHYGCTCGASAREVKRG